MALDRGANLRMAGQLPSPCSGLRDQSTYERGLGQNRHDPPYGAKVRLSILRQLLREQPDVEIVRSDVRLPDIERGFVAKGLPERHFPACRTRRPRRSIVRPTTVGQGRTRRPSPKFEGFGCRNYSFEAHLCGSCVHYGLPVRLHACSPPRLAATQLARSSVLNRLIAPTGLSPALTPASRARRVLRSDS
jgi:hypothetical protein